MQGRLQNGSSPCPGRRVRCCPASRRTPAARRPVAVVPLRAADHLVRVAECATSQCRACAQTYPGSPSTSMSSASIGLSASADASRWLSTGPVAKFRNAAGSVPTGARTAALSSRAAGSRSGGRELRHARPPTPVGHRRIGRRPVRSAQPGADRPGKRGGTFPSTNRSGCRRQNPALRDPRSRPRRLCAGLGRLVRAVTGTTSGRTRSRPHLLGRGEPTWLAGTPRGERHTPASEALHPRRPAKIMSWWADGVSRTSPNVRRRGWGSRCSRPAPPP